MKRLFLLFTVICIFMVHSISFAQSITYNYYFAYKVVADNIPIRSSEYTLIQRDLSLLSQDSFASSTYSYRNLIAIQNNNSGVIYFSTVAPTTSGNYGRLYSDAPIYVPMTVSGSSYYIVSSITSVSDPLFSFPPRFPSSTGLSYNYIIPGTDTQYLNNLRFYCNGVTIPSGQAYAICPVSVTLQFSGDFTLPTGSFYFPFNTSGAVSSSGSVPAALHNGSSYVTNVISNSSTIHINAFDMTSANRVFIYGDFYVAATRYIEFSFVVYYFVTENIPSFTYSLDVTNIPGNTVYYSDTSGILASMQNQNNILSSANGANNGLNDMNSQVSSALTDYQRDTDTSTQFGNISDSFFNLDTSIFTSVASTSTLFSACVTAIFNALGDFSTVLTLFLVFVLVGTVIGIMRYRGD